MRVLRPVEDLINVPWDDHQDEADLPADSIGGLFAGQAVPAGQGLEDASDGLQ